MGGKAKQISVYERSSDQMRKRWTEQEIWDWYNARPWINGCNFIPHNIINAEELWQEEGHEEVIRGLLLDISLMVGLGFNTVRISLPSRFVWENQHDGVMKRFDDFLNLLYQNGITAMIGFSGDCLMPKDAPHPQPHFGKQPEPVKGHFGGDTQSPFDGTPKIGWMPEDDTSEWASTEKYLMEFAQRYKDDDRVSVWNIWNEAGNSHRDTLSLPFIARLFNLMRELNVSQPLTADVWGYYRQVNGRYNFKAGLEPIERICIELSDIITFHYYGDYIHCRNYIEMLQQFGRPIVNTEWLHRPWGSFIQTHLPLFKKYNVGSCFFGFVNGKAQFDQVWDFIRDDKTVDTSLWMHDIFHSDGTPYDQDEIDTLMAVKAQAAKEWAEKQKVLET